MRRRGADTPSTGPCGHGKIGGESYDPYATREAMADITTMLDWAMAHDAAMADRVLAAAAPGLFGLSRWPELQRACDWLLVDRARGPDWAGAVAAIAMGASMMGRVDVLALTDDALRLAEEAGDLSAVHHLRVGPSYARLNGGDLAMVRALTIDAMANGDHYPAIAASTALAEACAYVGQLDELGAVCRLAAQLADHAGFGVDNSAAGPAQAVAVTSRRPRRGRARSRSRRPAWALFAVMWAEMASCLALDRDDPILAARAAEMIDPAEVPGTAGHRDLAMWAQHVMSGDLEDAAAKAHAADTHAHTVFQRGYAVWAHAATLAAGQRWDDTWAALHHLDRRHGHHNRTSTADTRWRGGDPRPSGTRRGPHQRRRQRGPRRPPNCQRCTTATASRSMRSRPSQPSRWQLMTMPRPAACSPPPTPSGAAVATRSLHERGSQLDQCATRQGPRRPVDPRRNAHT